MIGPLLLSTALLVGINDYSAAQTVPGRDLPSLSGAVNDVAALKALLQARGFKVITLVDRQATREAILAQLKHDVDVFYFAGHGSQVRNSRSDELDKLDESIVPADGKDIRDKELRPLFNRMLDRGRRLTVILDNCHSGSGVRGSVSRGVAMDPRDVADRRHYGPRPENRGALVLSATQDFDKAWETRGDDARMHGAFSWALLRAIRDAAPGESAEETFLRAQARMRKERPDQDPVLAGIASARRAPLFGGSRRAARDVVGIENVRKDGTVLLAGGWANGLAIGSELRVIGSDTRLTVTSIESLARSTARISGPGSVQSGALAELSKRRMRLEPAPGPYDLIVRKRDGSRAHSPLVGGQRYILALRPRSEAAESRYVYVFVIDSRGNGILLYPRSGSVENRFPRPSNELASFEVTPPYGIDTYYLLTSDQPLANPWVLQWDGARAGPRAWSVDKVTFESVAPQK